MFIQKEESDGGQISMYLAGELLLMARNLRRRASAIKVLLITFKSFE
jgi:hypothetical protein